MLRAVIFGTGMENVHRYDLGMHHIRLEAGNMQNSFNVKRLTQAAVVGYGI